MQKIEFILYSEPIQEEWNYTALYKKAAEIGALIKVDEYNNELILSKVTDELIVATIDVYIHEIVPETYHEQMVPLDGGLRIEKDNLLIEHQCCSELNDYVNWKKIIFEETKEWKEIWIGHPSIYYRYKGNQIELSEYYDTNPIDKDIKTKMSFEKSEFIGELRSALLELEKFKERVYQVIENGNYKNKEVLKRALIQ